MGSGCVGMYMYKLIGLHTIMENLFLASQIQLGLISLATWPHEKGLF